MITFTSDREVGEWVRKRIPGIERWMDEYVCFGIVMPGQLGIPVIMAGVVYDAYTGHDINMHMAIDDMRAVNRKTLKAAFSFPFVTLNCLRVTGLVPSKNEKARSFDERLGFVLEGTKKFAFPDDDELIYGMYRDQCRWLK